MVYLIFTPKPVKKSLERAPLPWRDRILRVLIRMQKEPFLGNKTAGAYKGKWKIRIWPYRIIYRVDLKSRQIVILEISHRGDVSYD